MNTQRPVPKYFVVLAGTMAAGGLAVLFGLQAESYLSAALTFLFSLPVFCGAFYFPFSQLFFKMKTMQANGDIAFCNPVNHGFHNSHQNNDHSYFYDSLNNLNNDDHTSITESPTSWSMSSNLGYRDLYYSMFNSHRHET